MFDYRLDQAFSCAGHVSKDSSEIIFHPPASAHKEASNEVTLSP